MSAIDNYGNEVQPTLAEVERLRSALAAAEQERDAARSDYNEFRAFAHEQACKADDSHVYTMARIDEMLAQLHEALLDRDEARTALAAAVDALREEHDARIRADEQRKMAEARAQATEKRAEKAEAQLPTPELHSILAGLAYNLRLTDFILATGEEPEKLKDYLAVLRGEPLPQD